MNQAIRHEIRLCTSPSCGTRFPVREGDPRGLTCPRCNAPALLAGGPFAEHKTGRMEHPGKAPAIEVLLDNIRSLYNVGSIFRTSDGAGARHLHLCGITPTPENPKLKKTALGADEVIGWTYHPDACLAAAMLKARGMRLWALEGGDRSEPLIHALPDIEGPPMVLVLGNEVSGVDPGILAQCDRVVSLPMQGIKSSLNTSVAFGIAVYTLRFPPLPPILSKAEEG